MLNVTQHKLPQTGVMNTTEVQWPSQLPDQSSVTPLGYDRAGVWQHKCTAEKFGEMLI